jgi:3-methyladenine DNA glycosylase AlkC
MARDDRKDMRPVKMAIASLPSCPAHVLEALSNDDVWVREVIAKNPSCPKSLLMDLVASSERTHLIVAENNNCPEELRASLLKGLEKNQDIGRRLDLARSPVCSASSLEALTLDKDKAVRDAALARLPGQLKECIGNSEGRANWIRKEIDLSLWAAPSQEDSSVDQLLWPTKLLLEKGVNNANGLVRALALSQSVAAVDALAKNQQHVSWLVRAAIARNRNCPDSVLNTLQKDSHQVVAGLARKQRIHTAEVRSNVTNHIDEICQSPPDLRVLLDAIEKSLMAFNTPKLGLGPALIPWLPDKARNIAIINHLLAMVGSCCFAGWGEDQHALIAKLGQLKESELNKYFARNTACPESLIRLLAKSKDRLVRYWVASNTACPVDLFEVLAKDSDVSVRESLSRNSTCPVALLELLAKDMNPGIRASIAGNRACPSELRDSILRLLAKNKDATIRESVAVNPSSPTQLLEYLSKDKEYSVRMHVANNPACSESIFAVLSKDADYSVRYTVASNPNSPLAVLEELAKDESYVVRGNVAGNPSTPVRIIEDLAKDEAWIADGWRYRQLFTKNPICPLPILEALAKDPSEYVYRHVADNPACPSVLRDFLFEKMAKDEDKYIRQSVALNPACSIALLGVLAKNKNWNVRCAVAENPTCPMELRQSVLDEAASANKNMFVALLAPRQTLELADCVFPDCPPKLKLIAALQPDCPEEQLFKAANSADPLERLAAACNPKLPTAQVMRLLDDLDVNVQRAVAQHLQRNQ